ncbi:MAG: hypothetical protein H6725_19460 [Sandaracinaceae bacterium]|jgi:hypothetical protein|nr:hypothetical protein [Sandaracinaceae bacterium]
MLRRVAFATLGGCLGLVAGGVLGLGGGMGAAELLELHLEPAVTLTLVTITAFGGLGLGVGATVGARRGRKPPRAGHPTPF